MQIKEIKTPEEISKTLEIFARTYTKLNRVTYVEDVLEMMTKNYRIAAVYERESVSDYLGLVGIRTITKLHHGRIIEIEDFVIDRKKNETDIGNILIHWVEEQAKATGCNQVSCNIETKRVESQRIFSHEKFILDGFCFRKTC